MKTLSQIIPLLFTAGSRTEQPASKRAASKASVQPPDKDARLPDRVSFAEDDSPPGYKIQWRH